MTSDRREDDGAMHVTAPVTVLLVEDEFVVAMTLKVQLESLGCEVVGTARDADGAIALAEKLHPQLVLMDIGLPGRSGLEAVEEIMAQTPTNIVVVTAYGEERAQEALAAGAKAVLTKPIPEEQLASMLEEITGEGQSPAGGVPRSES
ncbi:MAG: response regulator [Armatimonadetes bacterium]|nr:response regulator [Armatimonadota bacterium]